MFQFALVEHDRVEIELLQIFRWLLRDGDAAILAMREGVVETPPIAGDVAATMRDADFQFGKAFEIAVENQMPDAQRGIQRMSDRVRKIMILHAADQAGAERMKEDHHAELLDAGKNFSRPARVRSTPLTLVHSSTPRKPSSLTVRFSSATAMPGSCSGTVPMPISRSGCFATMPAM